MVDDCRDKMRAIMSVVRWKSCPALIALLGLMLASVAPADAQDAANYPVAGRSIRLVIPHGAGSGADILARLVGPKLAERWKVSTVADNRTGASGDIGIVTAAGAEPDGYTLLCVATVFTINPFMKKNPPYDPVKSFAPVSLLATSVLSLLVGPNVPAKTLPEFVALAHKQPGKLNYASSGIGSPQFVTMELLKLETKSDIVHIPYKDAPGMFRGMLTDEVQAQIQPLQTAAPQVANGNARMLAVMSANRAPSFPDVPTMRDLGYPNFVVETWYGIFAPAGTPALITTKLSAELNSILQEPEVRAQLERQGMIPVGGPPEHLGTFVQEDLARWKRVVTETGLKPE
jgi:tripartite-type tricarboxylate transporter receptor subunit TctC